MNLCLHILLGLFKAVPLCLKLTLIICFIYSQDTEVKLYNIRKTCYITAHNMYNLTIAISLSDCQLS